MAEAFGSSLLTVGELLDLTRSEASPAPSGLALQRVADAWELVNATARRRPVYGRTTGVGANRTEHVDHGADVRLSLNLLRSHATGSGRLLEPHEARAAIIVRLRQILSGGSGLHPSIVDAMVAALADGDLPRIHAEGSIGTGDLSAMAELGLGLAGELPLLSGARVRRWQPQADDALPLMSSNALTISQAAFALEEMQRLLAHAQCVAALSLVAVRGSLEPFALQVQQARPYRGQHTVAENVQRLVAGTQWQPLRIQDSFGFRALPQVVGPAVDACANLDAVLESELNAAAENPLVSARVGDVFHNGNFHAQALALAADQAALTLAGVAQMGLARLNNLSDPFMTGQRPFLASEEPGSSGTMLLEYVAAAGLARLRSAAAPATLGSVVISRATEDHASFAPQAVAGLRTAATAAATVLACELVAARRAFEQCAIAVAPDSPLAQYLAAAPEPSAPASSDRPLSEDVTAAERFISTYDPFPSRKPIPHETLR